MSDALSMTPQTVMITRPTGQAAELIAAVRAAGCEAVEFPLLEIRPVSDASALHTALSTLDRYALVVFVSPNAIDQAMAYRDAIGVSWPKLLPIGVMGPGSVRALAQWGIATPRFRVIAPKGAELEVAAAAPSDPAVDVALDMAHDFSHELTYQTPEQAYPIKSASRQAVPTGSRGSGEALDDAVRYDSEALLEALDHVLQLDTLAGREVLLVRGDGGRELFAETLRAMGVIVTTVTAYHRSAPQPTEAQWQALAQRLDQGPERLIWLFTSSEGVRYLNDLACTALSAAHYAALKRSQAIAPHARIAETARSLGFDTITLSGAGDRNIVGAILSLATPLAPGQTTKLVSRRMTDTHDTSLDTQPGDSTPAASSASNSASTTASQPASQPASQSASQSASQPASPSAAKPTSPSASQAAPRPDSSAAATPPLLEAVGTGAGRSVLPWLILLIVVLAAGGGAYVLNRKMERLQQLVSQRQDASEARLVQVMAQAHQFDTQLGQVNSKAQDTQSAEQALQQQYQDLARNRDDWTLAEIGQMLSTASEQLQLTGNVQLALFALQSADLRLAANTGPQMLSVRRAIQQDIEKLKATPQVDLAGMAIKLDDAIAQVDTLPLLGEEKHPADQAVAGAKPAGSGVDASATGPAWQTWIKQMLFEAGSDLKSLVQVRRIDDPDAMLVAPDQGYFLRANLKLRLLSARLSLLARNQATLKSDLGSANAAVNRYFDPTSKRVQTVHNLLQQVDQASATVALPDMSASLAAVRQFKSRS